MAYSNLTVPSGQTQDESLILKNLVITSSTNYNTTIAFTFGDGQYQVSSQNVLPVKYVSSFFITDESLIVTPFNNTVYDFNIQNTGNIPIVSANYTIANYQFSHNFYENLMPTNTVLLSQPIYSTSFQTGSTYSISLQVRYADGSTSNAQSTVPAIASGETPTPTATQTAREQVAVQGVSGTAGDAGVTVYAQYVSGGSAVVVNGALFSDANGGTVAGTVTGGTVSLPTTGALTTIVITGTLQSGHTYEVTLTSSKGGSFLSPSFVAP